MSKPEVVVIAHNIRSLHNVGAIFRSSDCFGVSKVYLTGYTGFPPDNKISKVALGADEYIPWEKSKSLVRVIKKLRLSKPDMQIIALENNIKYPTVNLHKFIGKGSVAVILGEETKGHPKKVLDLVDKIVEIPMFGQKESLNVSVACGVVLYELSKNIKK